MISLDVGILREVYKVPGLATDIYAQTFHALEPIEGQKSLNGNLGMLVGTVTLDKRPFCHGRWMGWRGWSK